MSDLFWPGDERAGDLLTEATWLGAMVRVEQAWLDALVAAGLAAPATLDGLVGVDDIDLLARGSESTGNPVPGLVKLLRERSGQAWVHRGLTSQDVVDTALMLCARDLLERLDAELDAQIGALSALAEEHRATVMAGRTLTQHAVPITFGLKAAGWLTGVLDAADAIRALELPAQLGGAAGTLSAASELAGSPAGALRLTADAAARLGLADLPPWHTSRRPVSALGDALVAANDAWGRLAADVTTLSRPEIAELAEPAGRGGSSTMPHKQNPALAVLVRRAALAAPPLASSLHVAAAAAVDERPDGAWHIEWATVRTLGRRTAVAASQVTELLTGLRVREDRIAAHVGEDDLLAERDTIRAFAGLPAAPLSGPGAGAAGYLGGNAELIDRVLARAGRLPARSTPSTPSEEQQ
ncbi:lyase family protein [Nocardioides insulae]|uniref:lyase family protein n=1 Tax=Nocardioides insulae TaxID=394734 RepID=UPI00041FA7FC|nr:lyase family protein [Nocardioides insulae]